jgi:redox-sensitive bicupin YhaK (pirin superfamily)
VPADPAWREPYKVVTAQKFLEGEGAPRHPHRGFETVTYMIDGAFQHTDSIGGGGLITDGATQWMTAGAGILHNEVPRRRWSPAAACSTVCSCG